MKRLCKSTGFTLIEMIGVLAIISILAAMIVPNVIQQINEAVEDAEEQTLKTFADGLMRFAQRNRQIPRSRVGSDVWSTNIATLINVRETDIAVHEKRGCNRRFWFDPSSSLASPYAQGTGLAVPPTNARALFVSDISSGCTNNIGNPTSAAAFASAWDQTGTLTESATIKLYRVNFAELFHNVALNQDINNPQYSLDNGGIITLVSLSLNLTLMHGTRLNLSDNLGVLQKSIFITGPSTFWYTHPNWGQVP